MYIRSRLLLYRCLTCNQYYRGDERICKLCQTHLPWLKDACIRCAMPLNKQSYRLCYDCRHDPNHCLAKKSVFCFEYLRPIDHMIKAWKFNGNLLYERFFSDALINRIKQTKLEKLPDAIMSVPISKKRCQERGFNQAMQLSKRIAKQFKINRLDDIIKCSNQKAHQSLLNARDRKQHLSNTFFIKKAKQLPKHIALIDDVMTTGSTLNAMAKLLKQHDVNRVDYWGIARVNKKR